jgi:glutamate/tyrosine decarboxylase-like PLP-dependent enzyme
MTNYSILETAKKYAVDYLSAADGQPVFPGAASLALLNNFSVPLPASSADPETVLRLLHENGSANTVKSTGARYFGFVFGGTLPASLAANWLAGAWDQNAAFKISSPVAAQLEKVAGDWLLDLLRLPANAATGFVTGTTMANFCSMLAARHAIYKRKGWDSKAKGIQGAPVIKVVTGEEVHASMLRALMFAGFGIDNLIKVPADEQGRIRADKMPPLDDSTIVCIQAGNVNTGAIDPIKEICLKAQQSGAWIHIDGAFGLWARVSASKAMLAEGCELADSWAIDLHKWLNVPYDSGLVVCKDATILREALSINAAYLPDSIEAEPSAYTPELSRRARGIETWAALYSLGRQGVVEMIERCCRLAALFAERLRAAGFNILNEVALNQVLVSFGDAATTTAVIKKIQEDGTCWCGGTVWKGVTAMRISVSSWMTEEKDIEQSAQVITRIANTVIKEKSN